MLPKQLLTVFFSIVLATSAMGSADNAANSDSEILSHLHRGNLIEIVMGRLGQQRASDNEVKELADMLVKDHAAAEVELVQLARSEGLTLQPVQLTLAESILILQLHLLSGEAFDLLFVRKNVERHDKTLKFLRAQRDSAGERVAELVDKLLPKLQEHRDHAAQILADLAEEQ